MLLLVCGVLLVSQAIAYQQDYCYAEDEYPYLMLGSKTAYEFVHEKPRNPENVPSCKPVQFWLLSRHGTRYASKKAISSLEHLPDLRDQILRNHEERKQGRLCEQDLENLKAWSLDVFPAQAETLTNQGYDDLKFMARRFKSQFLSLLNKTYQDDVYVFRSTDTQRTKASAKAFAEGLFGSGAEKVNVQSYPNDTLLRAYKICPKWQDEVNNNNDTYREKTLFEMGPQMQLLIQNVSQRLGFTYRLTYRQIDDMYDMCRYDKSWNIRKTSPWCAIFSKEELQLLEYREDLETYYSVGYGNDINRKLGCPPVKDFIHRFSQIENDNVQPTGVFYFSHKSMVHMVLTQLGIAKDSEHLTHTNYNAMKNREWKTSRIGPFATNLAAVFFRCESGDRHRVMFFLEEKLYNFKGCNVGLCDWSYIKEKFGRLQHECSLDFCSKDWSGAEQLNAISWPLTALVTVIFHLVLMKI